MKPIRLFSIVYGNQYIDWFERGLMTSLLWPKNRKALEQVVVWDLWTTAQDKDRVLAIASMLGIKIEFHEMKADKADLVRVLIAEFEICTDYDSAFFWAAPDSIFGDGTLQSFFEIGVTKDVCVASAPLRVVADGFIDAMGAGPVSNAALVKLGMSRVHKGFANADATLKEANTFKSGVSWRKIHDDMYAVSFMLPSCYLMKPNRRDLKWFMSKPKFGNYDHAFGNRLVQEGRQRIIGSSDAAFMVELTPVGVSEGELGTIDPEYPEKYWQDIPHIQINRNTLMIWRAGD